MLLVALLAVATRLPALTAFPSPDEGGFLLLAAQWHPGTSLYGDYWVDRPPLLIALFSLAGGLVGLRLLGAVSVGASVLLAAALASALLPSEAVPGARARVRLLTAVPAAALLSTPLFGVREVDGELLATPWVLAGFLLLVLARRSAGRGRRAGLVLLAGLVGSAAWLVKQNVVDVFVLGAALAAPGLVRGRREVRQALVDLALLAGGLVVGVGLALGLSVERGTSPAALWSAVVAFRLQADEVIARSASSATSDRLWRLGVALLVSAAPVMVVGALAAVRRRAVSSGGLPVPALLAVLGWEVVAVVNGGSYWLHYLVGLVPGIVLLAAEAACRTACRQSAVDVRLASAVSAVALSCVLAVVITATRPSPLGSDVAVAGFLRRHAAAGDAAVVAYGHPDILQAAGLRSPYDDLWSLPVRVRDPRLVRLQRVLDTARPRWLVISQGRLGSWSLDATRAQRLVDRDYAPVARVGRWSVLERR